MVDCDGQEKQSMREWMSDANHVCFAAIAISGEHIETRLHFLMFAFMFVYRAVV